MLPLVAICFAMPSSEQPISLEARLRAIEDQLEIYNLIAGHPLSADTGADYYSRTMHLPDGVFDRGELPGAGATRRLGPLC